MHMVEFLSNIDRIIKSLVTDTSSTALRVFKYRDEFYHFELKLTQDRKNLKLTHGSLMLNKVPGSDIIPLDQWNTNILLDIFTSHLGDDVSCLSKLEEQLINRVKKITPSDIKLSLDDIIGIIKANMFIIKRMSLK